MEDWKEFSAKTADEALTNALIQLETSSDQIEYEVIEEEKNYTKDEAKQIGIDNISKELKSQINNEK